MELQSDYELQKPSNFPMRKYRILIVEDEKPIRDMVYFALGSDGYEIIEATDGREATEKLAQQSPPSP